MISFERKRNQISLKAKLWEEDKKDIGKFTGGGFPEGILGKNWEGGELEFLFNSVLVQAAITRYYRLHVLYTTEMYFSQLWRLEVQDHPPAWLGSHENPL